jgi:hypothetical protein
MSKYHQRGNSKPVHVSPAVFEQAASHCYEIGINLSRFFETAIIDRVIADKAQAQKESSK